MSANLKSTGVVNAGIIEQSNLLSINKDNITINPNLFYNSNFNGTSNWSGVNGGSISIVKIGDRSTITATKGTTNYLYCQTTACTHTAGTNQTLKFNAEIYVTETGTVGAGVWINNSGWQGAGSVTFKNNSLNIGWNHVEASVSVTHSSLSGGVIFAVYYTGTTAYMWHPKLELGSVASPWIPHTSESIYSSMNFSDIDTTIKNPVLAKEFIEY